MVPILVFHFVWDHLCLWKDVHSTVMPVRSWGGHFLWPWIQGLNVSYLVCMHYRTLVSIPLFQNQTLRPMAQIIASMSGAVLNLLLIMALGRVYEKLALKLTTWGKQIDHAVLATITALEFTWLHCILKWFFFSEMHRTQSEFDDNLTFKVFIFQFINFYASILYIAFIKGRFVGYPGNYKHIIGDIRNEDVSWNILK